MVQYPFYFKALYTKVESFESYAKTKTDNTITGLEQVIIAFPINHDYINIENAYLDNIHSMKELVDKVVQILLSHKIYHHSLVTTFWNKKKIYQ
ncbi:unnamed protein product [Cunninghamella blakesleeana]